MDTPIHPAARIEIEPDALILTIETIALTRARDFGPKHARGDLTQSVVLDCLIKISRGTWDVAPDDLIRSVRHMVQCKSVNEFRGSQRRDERQAEHLRQLEEAAPAWMSPEVVAEDRELAELHARALDELPEGCRRVYALVREPAATYKSVAKRLGVSESAVSKQVVKAQHRLRSGLLACGIEAQPARRGTASPRAKAVPVHPTAGVR